MKKLFFSGVILFLILTVFVDFVQAQGDKNQPKLVSLAPHITEIIFKLGAGEQLIGRSEFCLYPPSAASIESVGGYLNIDFEKIVILQPDIIFQFPNEENRRKLENLGFTVVDMPNETISDILVSIEKAGRVLNLPNRADEMIAGIRDTLALVSRDDSLNLYSPSALLVVGRQRMSLAHLYVVGKGTYLNEIWEICGGKNVMSDVDVRYFSVSKEDLIKKNIEVIMEFHPDWSLNHSQWLQEQQVWKLFQNLSAIRQNRIYIFTERLFVIPGPRITTIALRFFEIIENISQAVHD
ncbi:MAG: hypothetical protein EH225_00230 [Calditrichaeota bacterium]|nr:MAG: hypothetical protein EH221_09345 [bacterium]RQW08519.1 MAG: hypothetical protein EH225_00230 [Calditrichota bacterium]